MVTDDNAYVEYKDQAYEVGTTGVQRVQHSQMESQAQSSGADAPAAFPEQCSNAIEQAGGDASACDIDFASWLTNLTNDGTEDVGGTRRCTSRATST